MLNGKPIDVKTFEKIIKPKTDQLADTSKKVEPKKERLVKDPKAQKEVDKAIDDLLSEFDFQIIGEVGAEKLPIVKDNLQKARQMEDAGKTPKEIFFAIGWERTKDNGKWKYDLPDVNFKNIDVILNAMLENEDKTFTFEDIFEKGEVYKAYPNAKNIKIKFIKNEKLNQTEAGYNEKENTIYVNRQKFSDYHKQRGKKDILSHTSNLSGLRRVFLQELEHFVQAEEGFAKGGSSLMFENPSEYLEPIYQDIETIIKFSEENNLTPLEVYNRLKGTFNNEDVASFHKNRTLSELKDFIEEKKNERLTPFERYKRLAGEAEARNVEKRANMTPEERRQKCYPKPKMSQKKAKFTFMRRISKIIQLKKTKKAPITACFYL